MIQAGQICMSTERVIVQRSVVEQFRHVFSTVTGQMFSSFQVLVTPTAAHKNRMLVADAKSKGASILFESPSSRPAADSAAATMPTTIVDGVTRAMDLYTVESFGPITCMIVVESEEEAIAAANDSEYGLSSAVFTNNLLRALRVARKLEVGYAYSFSQPALFTIY